MFNSAKYSNRSKNHISLLTSTVASHSQWTVQPYNDELVTT